LGREKSEKGESRKIVYCKNIPDRVIPASPFIGEGGDFFEKHFI